MRPPADGDPFDVVHDHTGFAALAMANRLRRRWCTRCTGRSSPTCSGSTRATAPRRSWSRSARAQRSRGARAPARRDRGRCHNPLDVESGRSPSAAGEYLLWVARMNDDKGPQRAIAAARAAGLPLVLAGPVQPGQEEFFAREVEPHIDDDACATSARSATRASASCTRGARALLMPIRWAEPFGMVMVEAMACGTPVIAFPEGSAPEVVIDGETGFLVEDEEAMARAVGRLGRDRPRPLPRVGRASASTSLDRRALRARLRAGPPTRRPLQPPPRRVGAAAAVPPERGA